MGNNVLTVGHYTNAETGSYLARLTCHSLGGSIVFSLCDLYGFGSGRKAIPVPAYFSCVSAATQFVRDALPDVVVETTLD
jgi:hypothetical protein